MSKRIQVTFICPDCKASSQEEIFRTIWGERPNNRELVFTNKVNRLTCKKCGHTFFVNNSLMYTNAELSFAVWFEPEHDPQIDADVVFYADFATRGPGDSSYLGQAPRIRDWKEFKATIEKFEKGELVSESRARQLATPDKQGATSTGRGCLLLFGFIVFVAASLFALAVNAAWK